MIVRLEIENFYSIRDRQAIDLPAAANAPSDVRGLVPPWPGASLRVPSVVVLFGANASGKSNVLRALSFLNWFVVGSFQQAPGAALPFQRFNDPVAAGEPTRLGVEFGGPVQPGRIGDDAAEQCRYAYEVVFGGGAGRPPMVLSEGIHYWPSAGGRRVRLVERDSAGRVRAARAFGLAGYRGALEKILRPNASLVSTLAQLNHPVAGGLRELVARSRTNIVVERYEGMEQAVLRHYAATPALVESLNREIERIDLGIRQMRILPGPDGPQAVFEHYGQPGVLPMWLESQGTRRFVTIYPLLAQVLETGGIATVDEIDAAIHPQLLPEIIGWFRDPARNLRNAQLWTSCHDAPLLNRLAKEEVFFCEKDGKGRTSLYGLADIRSVRRGENHLRKYLGGVYGAVPQIG